LELGIKDIKFPSIKIYWDLELTGAYRPWESLESKRSFFKELNELRKPGPLR